MSWVKGKPAGLPRQKPILKSDMAAGLKEVACKITMADSDEARKAAKYIYELGLYLESDYYKEKRKKANALIQAHKLAKDPLRGTRKRGKKSANQG